MLFFGLYQERYPFLEKTSCYHGASCFPTFLLCPVLFICSVSNSAGMKKHFKDYQNLADVPKAKRISSRHYKEQRKVALL